jgi:hypothetical protein
MSALDDLGVRMADAIQYVTQAFWDEWASRYPGLSQDRQWELQRELAGLIEEARAQFDVTYAGTIATDPTVTPPPINWPRQTIIQQVDGSGVYVALWWKAGDTIDAWTPLGSGGGPTTDRLVVAHDQPDAVAGALDQTLLSDGSILLSLVPGGSPSPVALLASLPIPESDVTGLVADLAGKVPTSTTVNGHALSGNISLTASDVGADASGAAAAITLAGLGGVPTTRNVAGHALSADVTITASDVGADPAGSAAAITLSGLGGVPTSRTVAGHALTTNVTITAADVGADAAGAAAAITLAGLGGIPTTQKGAASGVATLDTNTLVPVAQLPAGTTLAKGALQLGTTTGTACDGADSRLSNARTANAILETGGPTTLTVGAVADGQFLKRSGSTVIGAAASGGSVALSLYTSMMLG